MLDHGVLSRAVKSNKYECNNLGLSLLTCFVSFCVAFHSWFSERKNNNKQTNENMVGNWSLRAIGQ